MFLNPQISKQLADEHRRDLVAAAQQESLARQFQAGSGTGTRTGTGTAKQHQPLANRVWRRLRSVIRPGLEPLI
jgi:hypothetical protein